MKKIPNTSNELIEQYNELCDKIQAMPNIPGNQALESLTDEELVIFIAAKTHAFGRSFGKSMENARWHLENRDRAVRLFSQRNEKWESGVTMPL